MAFPFSPTCCCQPSVECGGCLAGTAPAQFQVSISGASGGFNANCCTDCDGLNNTFSLDYAGPGVFDGLPACYWLLYVDACAVEVTDYIRVVLYSPLGSSNLRLRVQVYAASTACPLAPQPLFDEWRELEGPVDCGEIDESFVYTRPTVSGDTAVCDLKSATVTVSSL